jgi:hypothetical protein
LGGTKVIPEWFVKMMYTVLEKTQLTSLRLELARGVMFDANLVYTFRSVESILEI